jgi:HD-like signal output (HDOD) protein
MKKRTEADILALLDSGYSLPALNPVALRIVEMASDDRSSARDLAGLIEKDPSLSVRFLKLANSSFYRTVEPVAAIDQAVVKIGFQRLRIMALSISLRETFPMGKVGPVDYEKFWKTSLYRGLIAKSLAERLHTCNPAEAFLASFILEVGLLVFVELFLKDSPNENLPDIDSPCELLEWERKSFDIDHRRIGEAALKFWRFPDHIVRCQHASTGRIDPGGKNTLLGICEMAILLSGIFSRGRDSFDAPYRSAEKLFGLDQNTVNDTLVTAFEQVEETAAGLRVYVDREKDLLGIVEKAHTALSRISERISEGLSFTAGEKSPPSFDNLENGDRSVAYVLQAAAHEIRNPLTVVGGFARKLAAATDPDSPEGRYAGIIIKEALRLEKALAEMTNRAGGFAPSRAFRGKDQM